MSADLISKQGSSCLSDKVHGGTSSGYESMLRESDGSGSSTINEDSADESSGDRKKGNKKKLPNSHRSRSAPVRQSESPESSSRKSSPSSKNSSLSPTSRAWQERQGRLKEEGPVEICEYDADDVKRITRHRPDDETLRKNHDKIKELMSPSRPQEIPKGKDTYVVDRSNWSFDCKFLMCFSCRSRKTDL